ncbi:MAG: hypothetical protein ABJM06_14295 [Gilvibacter sp.]
MKGILSIINTFTADDAKSFNAFLGRKNRRGDAKNIQLFDLLWEGQREQLDVKVYGKPSKNSYHGLCKRLQDSLIEFVANRGFEQETSQEMDILKLLLASRILFEQKQFAIAQKTLNKAESIAQSVDAYPILNEIYHTKIQFAHRNHKQSLAQIITSAQENYQQYSQEISLNIVSASLRATINAIDGAPIVDQINSALQAQQIEVNSALTFKSLHQLMSIAEEQANRKNDYYSILSFMQELYEVVSTKTDFYDKHLYYRLQCHYLMAVTLFRNKQFVNSNQVLDTMIGLGNTSKTYSRQLAHKALLLKALNANYSGDSRAAISMLIKSSAESLAVQMSLAMCYFQQSAWDQAWQIVRSWHHSDSFYEKKMDWFWMVQKNIIEILLLIERDKLDLVLARMKSFHRRFNKQLKEKNQERVITFMKLVAYVYEHPNKTQTAQFKARVESSFDWIDRQEEDLFAMSFYAWLKAKLNGADLYQTTLDLVQN